MRLTGNKLNNLNRFKEQFHQLSRNNYSNQSNYDYSSLRDEFNKLRNFETRVLVKPIENRQQNDLYKTAIERRFLANLDRVFNCYLFF